MGKSKQHIANLLAAVMLLALIAQPLHVTSHKKSNGCGECCSILHAMPATAQVEPFGHESHCGLCSFEFATFLPTSFSKIPYQTFVYFRPSIPAIAGVSISFNGTNKQLRAPPANCFC
jgi:hypothetical protein